MKKITVLVDFDDVMNNFCETWISELNNLYGTEVHVNDIREWDIKKAFPSLSENQLYLPLYRDSFWSKVKARDDAVEYLKKLVDEGYDVVVVTASHPEAVGPKTRNVLFKYFPFIDSKNLIVTYRKDLIYGDVIIDDAPHNLEKARCCARILMTAPHNRGYEAISYGMVRVDNWKDIYQFITQRVYKG